LTITTVASLYTLGLLTSHVARRWSAVSVSCRSSPSPPLLKVNPNFWFCSFYFDKSRLISLSLLFWTFII